MKKLFTVFILVVLYNYADAQNTFPSSGNVGIGTSSPSQSLEIVNSSAPVLRIRNSSSGDAAKSYLEFGRTVSGSFSRTGYIGDGFQYSTDLGIKVDDGNFGIGVGTHPIDAPQFFIKRSNSYIGIGTNNPGYKLDVNGTINATNILINGQPIGSGGGGGSGLWSSSGSNIYFNSGNVGIGTTSLSSYKLSVNGTIRAKEVIVETGWSDFVFAKDYHLRPLYEVESFIQSNGHLPDVPSAKEVEENGVKLGEVESKLLQKIEELTLYVIELKKENEQQQAQLEKQSGYINSLVATHPQD